MASYYTFLSLHILGATIWAGAFVLVVGQLRVPIGGTAVWHTFATWAQTLARSSH